MMKTFLIIIVLFLSGLINAEKIADLTEIAKPQNMAISNKKLYISEEATIYIYSLKDFTLIKKFGKSGEGPEEFKITPFGPPLVIFPVKNELIVSSDTKISYFTEEGQYIREIKVPPFQVWIPAKNMFVATGTKSAENNKVFLNVSLYDKNLNPVKELYCSDMRVGPTATFNFPINSFTFPPYDDKIYVVAGKEGFVIEVFNLKGDSLYHINKDYKKIPVSESYKELIFNKFKTDPGFSQFFEFFKQRISFKKYYPPVQDMMVDSDRIYIMTFIQKKNLNEFIIMDLKGKELKRKFAPLSLGYGSVFSSPIYTIYNHRFYTLIENIDEEVWELHQLDFK